MDTLRSCREGIVSITEDIVSITEDRRNVVMSQTGKGVSLASSERNATTSKAEPNTIGIIFPRSI